MITSSADGARAQGWSKAAGALIVLAIAIFHVAVALQFAHLTWDDSAITLAFSRTLAVDGEVRPTIYSDRVEGYSTPLWMLVNALAFRFLGDPNSLLIFAKAATLALNIGNFAILFLLLRRYLTSDIAGLLVAAVATKEVFAYETINGMEHPLLLFLLLMSFWGYPNQSRLGGRIVFVAASTLAVTVRWEALWFVLPFMAVSVYRDGWRRLPAPEHLLWAGAFIGLTVFRWSYFGDLLPNTIIAKAQPPYSDTWWFHRLQSRGGAIEDIAILLAHTIAACFLVVAVGVFGARQSRRTPWRGQPTPELLVAAGIVLAGLTFNAATGRNLGPPTRLFLPSLPFFLVLVAILLSNALDNLSRIVGWLLRGGLFATACFTALATWSALSRPNAPSYMPGVTVSATARIVEPARALRHALGLERLTLASPDMGGLLLYLDDVRVVDLGMLCSRALARSGQSGYRDLIFRQERPELIEAHDVWSKPFVNSVEFYDQYVPVFASGIRFFVRRDLVPRLAERVQLEEFDGLGNTARYDDTLFSARDQRRHDLEINRNFGRFYRLIPPPPG